MKIWTKGALLLVVVAAVLTACSPFVFTSTSLKGKTVTYYTDVLTGYANGHDTTTLTFDNTGTAGTFEAKSYTYGYADQTAVSSGKYTDQSWYQNSGYKGSFTYDPKAQKIDFTISDAYAPKKGATTMTNGQYAAADYTYLDLATYYSIQTNQTVTAASITESEPMNLTQDNLDWVYTAGSTANTWVSTSVMKQSQTVGGVTSTSTSTSTETYTIKSGSIVDNVKGVYTYQSGSGTPSTTTNETTWNLKIDKFFLVGKDTGSKTFSDVWKKKNTVTFQNEETSFTDIGYTGSTAPSAPTVNTTTGTGLTGGPYNGYNSFTNTMPYYYIDNNLNANTFGETQLTFTNMGDYMLFSGELSYASRRLLP